MTHEQAMAGNAAERYLEGRLSSEERAEFEDHYFDCEECFTEVESGDRMKRAVTGAVEAGTFPKAEKVVKMWPVHAGWALAASMLGGALGWQYMVREPGMRRDMDELRAEVAAAQAAVSETRRAADEPAASTALALLVLEAQRSGAAEGAVQQIRVPAGAQTLALWMEPGPSFSGPFRVEVLDAKDHRPVDSVAGLTRNAQGAVAVSIPVAKQGTGEYRARLFSGRALAAEYRYRVATD